MKIYQFRRMIGYSVYILPHTAALFFCDTVVNISFYLFSYLPNIVISMNKQLLNNNKMYFCLQTTKCVNVCECACVCLCVCV